MTGASTGYRAALLDVIRGACVRMDNLAFAVAYVA
jgi:hypothetical protein